MANTQKFTEAQIMTAIKGSAGIKVVICDRLKCSRQTLDNYIDRYPKLAEAVTNEREQRLDLSELLIITNIQILRQKQMATQEIVDSQDAWKLLDKLGRKRGYGERLTIAEVNEESTLDEDEIVRRIIAVMKGKTKKATKQ